VDGIITGRTADQAGNSMVNVIKAQLNRAKDDSRVKAVILKIDSPGGEVMASDEINKVITDFESDKPAQGDIPAQKRQARDLLDGSFGGERAAITFPRRAAGLSRTNSQSPASIGVIMPRLQLSRSDG